MNEYSYVEAIGVGFPEVECSASGDNYEDIVWKDTVISKQTLDDWIANNPKINLMPITVLAFRNRFTNQEKVIIDLASIDDPNSVIEQRQMAALLRSFLTDLNVARFVDLKSQQIIDSVNLLENNGIITIGRAEEILNSPILQSELY